MAEPDAGEVAVLEVFHRLAREYLANKHIRDQATNEMARCKEMMHGLVGNRTDMPPTVVGDEQIVYTVRSANRAPDAVALQRLGVAKEEFCTMTPSMKAFAQMVKTRKWGDEYAARFVIDSGEKTPIVSVRPLDTEEN